MIVTPRRFSAEVLRRGLRTFITSNVIWIKIRFPLFVTTCPYPTFLCVVLQCHVVRCHSVDVCRTHHLEIAVQTMVGRHVQNIQNRSSTRAPQFSTSRSDWDETDLPNSPCTDVSCCLPARISRVPHLRIQSCSLEINLAAVRTCLNLDSNHRPVYCCHSH